MSSGLFPISCADNVFRVASKIAALHVNVSQVERSRCVISVEQVKREKD